MAILPSEPPLLRATVPIALVADRAPCLLVGGGLVALRKAEWLLACGATITAWAADFIADFTALDAVRLKCTPQAYGPGADLRGFLLVIAATDDAEINHAVADDAERAGIPVNVVDDPSRCTFFVPATVARGALRIAITTGGGSPVLAGQLRQELESTFPLWYADYLAALGLVREQLRTSGTCYEERARLLRRLVSPEFRATLSGLDGHEMRRRLEAEIVRPKPAKIVS